MYIQTNLSHNINLVGLLAEYVKIGKGKSKAEKKKIREEYKEKSKIVKQLRREYIKEEGKKIFISPSQKYLEKYANDNRKHKTQEEIKTESILIQKNIEFETQKPIILDNIPMILDFYIPKLKLVIEVDGGYHKMSKQQIKDKKRDKTLQKYGYSVMRIPNELVNLLF